MTRRHQTTVCREGWYYLVVLALVFGGALLREVNLLLVLGGMLAGPVLFSWRVMGLSLRGLGLTRRVPQSICAGDLLVAKIELSNTRPRLGSWDVLIEEQIRRQTDRPAGARQAERPIRPQVLIPYVPVGQSRQGVYPGRLSRRGRYRLGPLRLSTRFPFGLFRRTVTVAGTQTLIVFPRLGRLTGGWLARHRESLEGTHRRVRRQGCEGDFYGVREWRSGDSRRWIHWRGSARLGRLVVCQFEQPHNRDVAVLLDLWQPEKPRPEHIENVELAVSFAATVVAELCRKGGNNLHLGCTATRPQSLHGPASAALLEEVMGMLAVAEAHSDDRLKDLLQHSRKELKPGTEIVLIGTRPLQQNNGCETASPTADPTPAALGRQIRYIDTSSDQLAEYYQPSKGKTMMNDE